MPARGVSLLALTLPAGTWTKHQSAIQHLHGFPRDCREVAAGIVFGTKWQLQSVRLDRKVGTRTTRPVPCTAGAYLPARPPNRVSMQVSFIAFSWSPLALGNLTPGRPDLAVQAQQGPEGGSLGDPVATSQGRPSDSVAMPDRFNTLPGTFARLSLPDHTKRG